MSKQRNQRRERQNDDYDPVEELCRFAKGERKTKPQIPITMNLGFTTGQLVGVIGHAIDSVPGVHNFKVGFTVGMEKVRIDVSRKQDEQDEDMDDDCDDDDNVIDARTTNRPSRAPEMFIPPTVNARLHPV